MTHVMVTGVAGNLGSVVIRDLLALNIRVTAVANQPGNGGGPRPLVAPPGIRLLACDLENAAAVAKLAGRIQRPKVLVHLQNGPPRDATDYRRSMDQAGVSVHLISHFGGPIEYAVIVGCADAQGTRPNVPAAALSFHNAGLLASEQLWRLFAITREKSVTRIRLSPLVYYPDAAETARASRAIAAAVKERGENYIAKTPDSKGAIPCLYPETRRFHRQSASA